MQLLVKTLASIGAMLPVAPLWLQAISEQFIGRDCTQILLVDRQLADIDCLRLAMSKALGLGIVAGAAIVKVPQIIKIFFKKSATGLSLPSYAIESIAAAITLAYNWRHGNPITTYGECFFILLQNALIITMMGMYRKQTRTYLVIGSVLAVLISTLFVPTAVCNASLAKLQTATIPLIMMSRIPQIWSVYRNRSAGQLSTITILLVAVGSIARVYTSFQETADDRILVGGFVAATALNNFLLILVLYFRLFSTHRTRRFGFGGGQKNASIAGKIPVRRSPAAALASSRRGGPPTAPPKSAK